MAVSITPRKFNGCFVEHRPGAALSPIILESRAARKIKPSYANQAFPVYLDTCNYRVLYVIYFPDSMSVPTSVNVHVFLVHFDTYLSGGIRQVSYYSDTYTANANANMHAISSTQDRTTLVCPVVRGGINRGEFLSIIGVS